jgi:hypothetical protein
MFGVFSCRIHLGTLALRKLASLLASLRLAKHKIASAFVQEFCDFYRNYGYPFIDPTHGGTFEGVLQAADTVMKLAGPKTTLVPEHGTILHAADIAPYSSRFSTCEQRLATIALATVVS